MSNGSPTSYWLLFPAIDTYIHARVGMHLMRWSFWTWGLQGWRVVFFFYFYFFSWFRPFYFELGGSPENFKTYTGLVKTIQRQLPFRNFDFFWFFVFFNWNEILKSKFHVFILMLTGVFIYVLIERKSGLRLSLKMNTIQLRSFLSSLASSF